LLLKLDKIYLSLLRSVNKILFDVKLIFQYIHTIKQTIKINFNIYWIKYKLWLSKCNKQMYVILRIFVIINKY